MNRSIPVVVAGIFALMCMGVTARAVDAPADANATKVVSTTQDANAEPAASTWPPGLIMDALKAMNASKGFDDLNLRIYGYAEGGFTGRLTGGQHPLPGRLYDARRPNNARLDQVDLTVERPYDNTKDFDFGFRFDTIFGGDPMLTHSAGLLDKSGSGQGDNWTDLLQGYGQLWFKTGKESGLELTFGKFVEPAGLETVQPTGNALYSHSYIYSFDEPTSLTGVTAKYFLNSQIFAYFGVAEGWDVFNDNNNGVTYLAGGGWSSSEQIGGHPKDQVLLNVITGPEQPDDSSDYRTLTDVIWTHYWTDKLSESVNFDWLTEENVPGIGRENAYGPAHYLTYVFNDYVSGTWRIEWFRDAEGARIGADASWYESTWGVGITPCPYDKILKNLLLRPELRWDWADRPVFGDDHSNQLTLAFDVIFKF